MMGTPGTERGMAPLPWLTGIVLGAAVVMTAPVEAATLNNWQFDAATQQLVITLPKGVTPQYHLAAEPARIVVDLPNTEVGAVPMQQSYSGAVRQIRIAQFQPGLARIVLELSPEAVLAPGQVELQQLAGSDGNTQRWALRPLLVTDTPNSTIAQSSSSPEPGVASPVSPSATTPPAVAAPAPVASTPETVSVPSAPNPAPTDATEVAQPVTPSEVAAAPSLDSPASAASADATDSLGSTEDENSDALPPLEPGAVEIPIQMEAAAEPETVSEPTVSESNGAPTESVAVAEPAAPTVATAPELPTPSPLPPASSNPAPVVPAPTAAVSAPLPVDFSRPPELATGTAASLALPSVGQAAINTPTASSTPSSGTLSFPRPTASGVSVPSINTVNTVMAETPAAGSTAENRTTQPNGDPSSARQPADSQRSDSQSAANPLPVQPAPAAPLPSAPGPAPTAAMPSGQPIPAQPQPAATASPSDSVIPFGQPLVSSPSATATNSALTSPAPTPPNSANNANDTIPFGQPIPSKQPDAAPLGIPVIPFGQPLPAPQSSINSLPEAASKSAAVVPSGTVLKLRYAGESALSLAEQPSRPEVLLLEQSVHDQAGNLVFPAGSPVIGRFETNETGSQFIAQAVQVQGQNITLSAQSEQLTGGRQIQQNGLLRNSAIGAVAGTLLGAVSGIGLIPAVIAGAATSAATTYVTSPEAAAVIQPNQVVEVRLMQDLVQ